MLFGINPFCWLLNIILIYQAEKSCCLAAAAVSLRNEFYMGNNTDFKNLGASE